MRLVFMLIVVSLLAGCAGKKYTVDDGRAVNEELLSHIRSFGAGEKVLRPAIARSATLKDPDCDRQWELPFSVATSYDWSEDDRVAWVRALGVDERVTVVGVTPDSPLKLGDKIRSFDNYRSDNSEDMLTRLAALRERGFPINVGLSNGTSVTVHPFQVCRGYTRLAPPGSPKAQDYHWLMSVHPLEVTRADLTDDEALWMVLWTQGVSEEGGVRMKAYSYTTTIAGTAYSLFSLASGLQGAALAANAAVKAAQSAAAAAATEVLKQQLMDQATSYASSKVREQLVGAVQKLSQQQVMNTMQQAAANRGALSGVAWVASTVFDRADAWAYTRMEKLQANPLAGFTLHQKLLEQGLASNSMVLDPERMSALNKIATAQGRGEEVTTILQGIKPDDLQMPLTDMPLATAPAAFSYDDLSVPVMGDQPYARGLIDGMLHTAYVPASATK